MKQTLEDLPESRNEFWDGEVNVVKVEEKPFLKQAHFFERTRGHQAQCNHCDWGFELDPGDRIENGHLYTKKGKKVL